MTDLPSYLHLALDWETGRWASRARRVKGGIGQGSLGFGGESLERVSWVSGRCRDGCCACLCGVTWRSVHSIFCAGSRASVTLSGHPTTLDWIDDGELTMFL